MESITACRAVFGARTVAVAPSSTRVSATRDERRHSGDSERTVPSDCANRRPVAAPATGPETASSPTTSRIWPDVMPHPFSMVRPTPTSGPASDVIGVT